jgi:hypothetical protein
MIQFVKRHKDLFLISTIATVFYFVMLNAIGIAVSEDVMYSTVDGNSYRQVALWIGSGDYTPYIGVRPFLYPLLISIANFIGCFTAIWMFQFVLWLLSVNILYLSIVRLTERKLFGFIGAAIFIINLSLISLTFHALSEVATTFLLSLLLWLIAKHKNDLSALRFMHGSILILGLLTVVRPMFLVPLIAVLVLLPIVKFKTYLRTPAKLIWVGIVLLPVFLQMGILKWNYDEFGISMRSSDTVDYYLMAQCISQDKGIELTAARALVTEMSTEERGEYKASHIGLMSSNLIINIQDNIKGDSYMLLHLPEIENAGLRRFMVNMNKVFYQVHLL